MFQNFRAREFAVFRYVAEHKRNNAFGLAQADEFAGAFAHLRHGAGGRRKFRVIDGLDGIQNQYVRVYVLHRLHDFLHVRFAV